MGETGRSGGILRYMYIAEFFYGNAGTVNYAACSFVETPCWKYFLAFHVSIEKEKKKSIVSHIVMHRLYLYTQTPLISTPQIRARLSTGHPQLEFLWQKCFEFGGLNFFSECTSAYLSLPTCVIHTFLSMDYFWNLNMCNMRQKTSSKMIMIHGR